MKPKYTSIEFIRFLAAVAIVMFHFGSFYLDVDHYFPLSFVFVEFFFVISGFFMMKHIKESSHPLLPAEYVGKKIKGFFPILSIVFCVQFVIFVLSNEIAGVGKAAETLYHFKWEFLLLHGAGFIQNPHFGVDYLQGQTWYLSAMVLALAIAYPLAKYFQRAFLHIICPLSIIVIYSYIMQTLGTLNVGNEYFGIVLAAFPRGFAGTCAGCLSYEAYVYAKEKSMVSRYKSAFTVIEVLCYAGIAAMFVLGSKMAEEDSLFYVVIFVAVVALACLDYTPVSHFLNNKGIRQLQYLGRLSLYLYLCHWNVVMAMRYFVPDMDWKKGFFIYMPIVFIYAIGLKVLDEKRKTVTPVILICVLAIMVGFALAEIAI